MIALKIGIPAQGKIFTN